jgi:hypothetical protein
MRGAPLLDDDVDSIAIAGKPFRHHKQRSSPPESMRPSCMRGMSFDDDDDDKEGVRNTATQRPAILKDIVLDDNNAAKGSPQKLGNKAGVPVDSALAQSIGNKSTVPTAIKMEKETGGTPPPVTSRPSKMRGAPLLDDDVDSIAIAGKPLYHKQSSPPPEYMRPSCMRGMSFDDDDDDKEGARSTATLCPTLLKDIVLDDNNAVKGSPQKLGNKEGVSVDSSLARSVRNKPTEPKAIKMEKEMGGTSSLGKQHRPTNAFIANKQERKSLKPTDTTLVKAQAEEKRDEASKKCYMWYARMGQPDRANMKRRVAALPQSCDITVEDVELLPWIGNGKMLSVKAMNMLFTGPDAE